MDYRGSHQPFADGPALYDMTPMWGEDVYSHPEWYAFGEREPYYRETIRVFLSVRNRPDAEVTVYRAIPHGVPDGLHRGDWVALSRHLARQHGMHATDPAQDWPVISRIVKARDVMTGGSDIMEWGYFGEDC